MTREQFIDEIHDAIALEVKFSKPIAKLMDIEQFEYLKPEKVAEIVEYRLQWLFDNYTFIEKKQNVDL